MSSPVSLPQLRVDLNKHRKARYAVLVAIFATLSFHLVGYVGWLGYKQLTYPAFLKEQQEKLVAQKKRLAKREREAKKRAFVLTDLSDFEEKVKPQDAKAVGLHSRQARQNTPAKKSLPTGAPTRKGEGKRVVAKIGSESSVSQKAVKNIVQKQKPLQKMVKPQPPTKQKQPRPEPKPPVEKKEMLAAVPPKILAKAPQPSPLTIPTSMARKPAPATKKTQPKQSRKKTSQRRQKVTKPRQARKKRSRPAPPIKQIGRRRKVRGQRANRNTRSRSASLGGDTMAVLRARWPEYFEIVRRRIGESFNREGILYKRSYRRGDVSLRFMVMPSGKLKGISVLYFTDGLYSEKIMCLATIQHAGPFPPLTPEMVKDDIFKDFTVRFIF